MALASADVDHSHAAARNGSNAMDHFTDLRDEMYSTLFRSSVTNVNLTYK